MGPRYVLLMDEISTGLDSATTYAVVKCDCAIVLKGGPGFLYQEQLRLLQAPRIMTFGVVDA